MKIIIEKLFAQILLEYLYNINIIFRIRKANKSTDRIKNLKFIKLIIEFKIFFSTLFPFNEIDKTLNF